jgi:hypothetical protein
VPKGYDLAPRLPIYAEFIEERYVDRAMLRAIEGFRGVADTSSVPGDQVVAQ